MGAAGTGSRARALAVALWLLAAALPRAAAITTVVPDGVHTFSPQAGQLMVSWTTFTDDAVTTSGSEGALVSYGLSPDALNLTARGAWGLLVDSPRNPLRTYDVLLSGLAPNTSYWYRPGGVNLTAPGVFTHNTTTPPLACASTGVTAAEWWYGGDGSGGAPVQPRPRRACTVAVPRVYGVLADFGLSNAVSMGSLYRDALDARFSGLILAGDMAYDLNSNNGLTGVAWFEMMEAVVTRVPLIAAAGNHESRALFLHYNKRFSGVAATAGAASGSNSARYYAFVEGLVQFIAVDTEFWFYGGTPAEIAAQDAWLAATLASIDRARTPWVVALMHKAFWMDSSNLTSIEPRLYAAGVDLVVVGHSHNYQRLLPMLPGRVVERGCVSTDTAVYYNCSGTTYLVVGAPGCREGISSGLARVSYLAASRLLYGYGYLTVHNWTHLQWQWKPTGYPDANDSLITPPPGFDGTDEAWIIKPRNAAPLLAYEEVHGADPPPPSPSPTASATAAATASATAPPTASATALPTATATATATASATASGGSGGNALGAGLGLGGSGAGLDSGEDASAAALRIAVGASAGGLVLVALVCYALRRRKSAARAVRRSRAASGSLYTTTDRRPDSVGSLVRGSSFSEPSFGGSGAFPGSAFPGGTIANPFHALATAGLHTTAAPAPAAPSPLRTLGKSTSSSHLWEYRGSAV